MVYVIVFDSPHGHVSLYLSVDDQYELIVSFDRDSDPDNYDTVSSHLHEGEYDLAFKHMGSWDYGESTGDAQDRLPSFGATTQRIWEEDSA